MSLINPKCPACGTEAEHRPQEPSTAPYRAYVSHDHGCRVSRYYAWIYPDGTQESRPIPDNVTFRRFARAQQTAS